MAKRFTDTDKWKKSFIRGLEGPYKLLWLYILDDCDMAGIWQKDFEVACIRIGEDVNEETAIKVFGDRIKVFGNKWFIVDFIGFQYGELKDTNRMHAAVFNTLMKNEISIDGASKPLPRGQGQYQGNGQGNGQGQGKIQPLSKKEIHDAIFTDEIYIDNLRTAHRTKDLEQAFEECYMHHSQKPNPPTENWEWRQKLNTWLTIKSPDQKEKGTKKAFKAVSLEKLKGK
jgi:hypothetical protein